MAGRLRARSQNNGLAAASLVIGVMSTAMGLVALGWFGILAVVFGHRARRQIRESLGAQAGAGVATGGLVLGYTAIGITVLVVIAGFSGFGAAYSEPERCIRGEMRPWLSGAAGGVAVDVACGAAPATRPALLAGREAKPGAVDPRIVARVTTAGRVFPGSGGYRRTLLVTAATDIVVL